MGSSKASTASDRSDRSRSSASASATNGDCSAGSCSSNSTCRSGLQTRPGMMLEAPPAATITDREWLAIRRSLQPRPSAQQMLIARLIIEEDLTNAAIARRLAISPRSVEKQLERLFAKLAVRSRAGLIVRLWMAEKSMRQGRTE